MTIENRFLTKFLSSYPLYKRLENNKEEFENKLHQSLFIEINKDIFSIPNYIIKNAQSYIKDKNSIRELLNYSLEKLSENIFILNNKPYIKESFFEEWQEIISRVSPLIIISYYLYKNSLESMKEVFTFSVLPSIYNKRLEYLLNEKIVDTHIHLNGTTEADVVWQDVLKAPSSILKEIEDGYQKGVVQEQFEQIDVDFNLSKLNQFFSEAREIKSYFVDKLDLIQEFSLVSEIEFFIKVFEYINKEKKQADIEKLYRYILIYNIFYKFLAQQNRQVGFDEFQKITLNGFREFSEKEYLKRYEQVKSIYKDNIALEGRFAPKVDIKKGIKLIDSILRAKDNIDLTLTCHFIKEEDTRKPENNYSYRDMPLRIKLENIAKQLNFMIKINPEYKKYIKGFDAASNELFARPEAFTGLFSFLRKNGFSNFTFHGGEDFIELISGLRYVYEIVDFLDFKNSNRIGHATALGIEPKLWKERVGKNIYITKGEYFDNLIFTYYVLNKTQKFLKTQTKILNKIREYCLSIYEKDINISTLIEAWKMRKENPRILLNWEYSCEKQKNYQKEAMEIFIKYHTNELVLKAYNDYVSVDTDFISNKVLKFIQNFIIDLLNKRNIIIESMISSNKLISFYNSYQEHHILRWLGIGKYKTHPKPTLVLASDDPGIFVTNIRNEYSHLYLILKNEKLSEDDIFTKLEMLVRNSQIYRF